MVDHELLGAELANMVRSYVAREMLGLREQLIVVEHRLANLPTPKDGRDPDPEQIRLVVEKAVTALPKPQDGKSVDVSALFSEIAAATARAVESIPKPKDGKDADLSVIRAEVERQVATIPKPQDGKDADPQVIASEVIKLTPSVLDFAKALSQRFEMESLRD